MSLERPDRCETCRFWERYEEVPDKGECRRNTPLILQHLNVLDGYWPDTSEFEWCGQWRPLPVVQRPAQAG